MATDNIKCPICGKKGTWIPDNAFRPFCSDRCKLIDLGAWAAEDHRIPGEEVPNQTEEGEDNREI